MEGFNSSYINTNSSTTIAGVGPSPAAGVPSSEGILHSISIGPDIGGTGAANVQVTIRDGTAASPVAFRVNGLVGAGQNYIVDMKFLNAIFVTVAQFAAINVTLTWR